MQAFLDAFAETIRDDEHVALVLDGAGWHSAKSLSVPSNRTLVPLPPYSPELNPVERVWLYLKERFLSMRLLNDYFAPMIGVAQKHGGTIDKFVGDGMMVYFGAPQPLPCPEQAALEAAHEMLIALRHLNAGLVQAGSAPLRIGIGIHVGDAVVGHVGTDRLHQYTAVGDVIGTAIRLEALSKTLDFPVIVSGAVADGVGRGGGLADLGEQPLHGAAAIRVFGWNPPTGPAAGTSA